MMKTLLTTEGSKEAREALRAAARLLRKTNNEFHLLCVGPELVLPPRKGQGEAERRKVIERYRRRMERETRAILDESGRMLSSEGVSATLSARFGNVADEIVRLADDFNVTVVGAGSRYQRSKQGLGPVASRVVECAGRMVLLARPLSGESALRVLIGVDGSRASMHALRTFVAYFDADEAEITLFHVVETPWIHLGLDREWFDSAEEDVIDRADPEALLEKELNVEAERAIEQARAALKERSYSVVPMIVEGTPATEILGEAEQKDYDLIVLGTSGILDMKHKVLGSVSARVAWDSPCSVALVKYTE
jgi:nucleotide-binding universal stress UspA family protein